MTAPTSPAAALPATGMPAGIRARGDSALFGMMLADAGGEGAVPDAATGQSVADDADAVADLPDVAVIDPVTLVPVVVPVGIMSVRAAVPEPVTVSVPATMPVPVSVPVQAAPTELVARTLPLAAGPRAGVKGDVSVVSLPAQEGGAVVGVPVPTPGVDDAMIASDLGSSSRGGAGVSGPAVADAAPAAAVMRDVSALLAAQPVAVTQVAQAMTQAVTPPAIGVAEAAIREQAAVLVERDEVPDMPVDASDAPMGVAGMQAVSPASAAAAMPVPAPVLTADAALGLQVAAARAGETLDGITRDIATAAGSGDAPMRFRLDPAALGPVMVEVARGADGLAVRIEARDAGTRDLIAEQQGRLVADARAAGVPIQTVQIEPRRDDSSTVSGYVQQQADPQAGGGQQGQAGQRPAPATRMPDLSARHAPARTPAGAGRRAAEDLYA